MTSDTTRDAFEAACSGGNMGAIAYADFKAGWQAATEQGKRQPLTVEQIAGKWRAAYLSSKAFTTIDTYTYFAREIEALHGITATPQGNQIAGNLAYTSPAYSKSIASTTQDSPSKKPSYVQGLLDAMREIDAEIECINIEYADSEPCRKAAYRALANAKILIRDLMAMSAPPPSVNL